MRARDTGKLTPLHIQQGTTTGEHAHIKWLLRPGKFSRMLIMIMLLALLLGGGLVEYRQLNQVHSSLYEVNTHARSLEWRQPITSPTQAEVVDAHGWLIDVQVGRNLHQLVAFDPRGTLQWKSFVSSSTFSLPFVPTSGETVLVALSDSNLEHSSLLHPSIFYLLRRRTGQVIWQRTMVALNAGLRATLLGADNRLIYVAVTQSNTTSNQTTELLALDQLSGAIAWRMVSSSTLADSGRLLIGQQSIFWQVAGTVYALNPTSGHVQWQRFLAEDTYEVLLQEESQMAETAGILVVERSDIYHALDVSTGKELWVLTNPDINAVSRQVRGGLAAVGNTLLIYGSGQIQAFDASSRQLRWSQKQLAAILNLNISADGTLAYATVIDSIEGEAPAQVLVALDLNNGAVKWTFQSTGKAVFVPLGAKGILLRHFQLVALLCLTSAQHGCTSMGLYVLQAASGHVIWKYQGDAVADVHYSADGNTLLFQGDSSAWSDLIAHFKD